MVLWLISNFVIPVHRPTSFVNGQHKDPFISDHSLNNSQNISTTSFHQILICATIRISAQDSATFPKNSDSQTNTAALNPYLLPQFMCFAGEFIAMNRYGKSVFRFWAFEPFVDHKRQGINFSKDFSQCWKPDMQINCWTTDKRLI